MEIKKALSLLKYYNKWRQGEETKMPDTYEITEALNVVIDELEKNTNP